ncbi:MAG: hypothetical protein GY820_02860 [Gammaproteobacteria bacterium]|nr:hypothetical protein [Gammaproteobacteria bacterium]
MGFSQGVCPDSSALLSFSELNSKAKLDNPALQEIGADEIQNYLIAKPQSNQNKLFQLYKNYNSFQFSIPGNTVDRIKKDFSMNANMVAFSIFSIALGRYFEINKIMINCTEAGRNHGGNHMQGFGMLARYFPCNVDLPRPELCSATATSIVTSYWDSFNNDFSNYLTKVRRIEIDTNTANFQFSYNYDGFIELSDCSKTKRKSVSVYPKIGIFDIVVNVCSTFGDGDKPDGNPGLLFKVDYAPAIICKESLENAFDY